MSIEAKKTANSPSRTMTRKIDLTTEAVVWRPRDFALPFTAKPSAQATTPMTSAMKGAFSMPTLKCVVEIASCKPGDEDLRAHAAVEPGNDAAAVKGGYRSDEGEHRQREDQRDDPRKDQDRDRIEAHRPQGVDFLAHLH